MKAPLFNIKGELTGETTLPKNTFEVTPNENLIATVLRSYLYNVRSAHAKVKDRGEVAGTTKKMWSQKGTGRARHGSAKAPLFVGGGVAHGPQGNENFKKNINKKVRKLVIGQILSKFAKDKAIIVIDQFKELAPKTKIGWQLIDVLEKANKKLTDSHKIVIITSHSLDNVNRAFRNIQGISTMSLSSLNPLNLVNQNFLILSETVIKDLSKLYGSTK